MTNMAAQLASMRQRRKGRSEASRNPPGVAHPCRIEAAEIYRLREADLAFGELLPEKPASLEQEEYEERTSVGFHLARLTKRAGELVTREFAVAAGEGEALERVPKRSD